MDLKPLERVNGPFWRRQRNARMADGRNRANRNEENKVSCHWQFGAHSFRGSMSTPLAGPTRSKFSELSEAKKIKLCHETDEFRCLRCSIVAHSTMLTARGESRRLSALPKTADTKKQKRSLPGAPRLRTGGMRSAVVPDHVGTDLGAL